MISVNGFLYSLAEMSVYACLCVCLCTRKRLNKCFKKLISGESW